MGPQASSKFHALIAWDPRFRPAPTPMIGMLPQIDDDGEKIINLSISSGDDWFAVSQSRGRGNGSRTY